MDFVARDGDRIALNALLGYTISAAAEGSALLSLTNGASVVLTGVAAADVAASWFVPV